MFFCDVPETWLPAEAQCDKDAFSMPIPILGVYHLGSLCCESVDSSYLPCTRKSLTPPNHAPRYMALPPRSASYPSHEAQNTALDVHEICPPTFQARRFARIAGITVPALRDTKIVKLGLARWRGTPSEMPSTTAISGIAVSFATTRLTYLGWPWLPGWLTVLTGKIEGPADVPCCELAWSTVVIGCFDLVTAKLTPACSNLDRR